MVLLLVGKQLHTCIWSSFGKKSFCCFLGVFMLLCSFWKKLAAKVTCVGGAGSLTASTFLLVCTHWFFWKANILTEFDELTLFIAWAGNQLVCTKLTNVNWASTVVFRCHLVDIDSSRCGVLLLCVPDVSSSGVLDRCFRNFWSA